MAVTSDKRDFQNGDQAGKPLLGVFKAFRNDDRGSAAMLFALAFPALFGAIGGAIDYSTIAKQRAATVSVADSAAISVAREMTLTVMTQAQVDANVQRFAQANATANGLTNITSKGTLSADGMSVKVSVTTRLESQFGIIGSVSGVNNFTTDATARVGQQNKLCLLSTADTKTSQGFGGFTNQQPIGVNLQNNSRLTAPGCVLQTNINKPEAFTVRAGTQTTASLICSVGGVKNEGGLVDAEILAGCPKILNPMEARDYPRLNHEQSCKVEATYVNKVYTTGLHILPPGIYCGNIIVEGNAKLTLGDGNFVIQGALIVRGDGELRGNRVGIYLTSAIGLRRPAFFRFIENALIDISAPETGVLAGILIWEGINGATVDYNAVLAALSLNKTTKVVAPTTVSGNYHQINTGRAKKLTGTIYLPGGHLLIDSPVQIADQSDYTVLVVNRLDLSDGPNLFLNSNYAKSRVPVPTGLGPIGARNVRLEK